MIKKYSTPRTPFLSAWQDWLGGTEGQNCSQPMVLKSEYLENRMHRAFTAGWNARESVLADDIAAKRKDSA